MAADRGDPRVGHLGSSRAEGHAGIDDLASKRICPGRFNAEKPSFAGTAPRKNLGLKSGCTFGSDTVLSIPARNDPNHPPSPVIERGFADRPTGFG